MWHVVFLRFMAKSRALWSASPIKGTTADGFRSDSPGRRLNDQRGGVDSLPFWQPHGHCQRTNELVRDQFTKTERRNRGTNPSSFVADGVGRRRRDGPGNSDLNHSLWDYSLRRPIPPCHRKIASAISLALSSRKVAVTFFSASVSTLIVVDEPDASFPQPAKV